MQKQDLQKGDRNDLFVSTFEACQSIKKAATIIGDEDMLHVLRGFNDDLIAAEAKYYKNCYALYVIILRKWFFL